MNLTGFSRAFRWYNNNTQSPQNKTKIYFQIGECRALKNLIRPFALLLSHNPRKQCLWPARLLSFLLEDEAANVHAQAWHIAAALRGVQEQGAPRELQRAPWGSQRLTWGCPERSRWL